MNAEKLLIGLHEERALRRNELFEGPTPSYDKVLSALGYDQGLTAAIAAIHQSMKGREDDDEQG